MNDDIEYDGRPETTHKVFLHTFWFGKGPVYTYEGSKLPPRISRAWFTHVHPPYYQSAWGIGIRLRKTTLRFGICYPRGRIGVDPYEETLEDMRRGLGGTALRRDADLTLSTPADRWEVEEVPVVPPEDQER